MLILLLMLVLGLIAAVGGLMACLFPKRWERVTELISFSDHWTVPASNRSRLRPVLRIANRVAGIPIFVAGCWFCYVALSSIYAILVAHKEAREVAGGGDLASSPMPVGNVFSFLMMAIGGFMVLAPATATRVFERVWISPRSVAPSAARTVHLVVRLAGFAVLALAILFRLH